jgi:hypothetical protein
MDTDSIPLGDSSSEFYITIVNNLFELPQCPLAFYKQGATTTCCVKRKHLSFLWDQQLSCSQGGTGMLIRDPMYPGGVGVEGLNKNF